MGTPITAWCNAGAWDFRPRLGSPVSQQPARERFDAVVQRNAANRMEQVELMLASWHLGVDHDIPRPRAQCCGEPSRGTDWKHSVPVAMGDEERRSVRADVGQRG